MSASALPWSTAWRIARRDLSARFRGLRLLVICLFLGVGAIAAIGSLTGSIEREMAAKGQTILGGDIEAAVSQRSFTPQELAAFRALGTVSGGLRIQAMASAGEAAAPVELKAVDAAWPLVGRLTLKDGRLVGAPPPGTAWLAEGTAERLGLAPGGTIAIGTERLTIGGIVADEPDRLGEGFAFGAVALVGEDVPRRAGLIAPGSMYRSKLRIALRPGFEPGPVVLRLKAQFPESGITYRTRDKAAPGAERFVDQMGEFLVLVGLAALAIAGIGIGGGVSSWLEARRGSIATLKVLGASSGDIARIYVLQVAAAAAAGSLAGLAAGVLVTPLLARALGPLLPTSSGFVIDAAALLRAAAYGLLVALAFSIPPLLRARRFPALALMRARIEPLVLPRAEMLRWTAPVVAAIVALALATAPKPLTTAGFLAGAAAVLVLLGLLGWAIRRVAAKAPRPHTPLARMALANINRPGSQTSALVTALGFGLSAFVLLAAVQTSLDGNIMARVPDRAPDYFVLDLPRDRLADFRATIREFAPQAAVRTVPNMRGAILSYGPEGRQTRVADLKAIPDKAWALRGERGITYSETVPEGNSVIAGRWWSAGHSGERLVSIDEEFAGALDLKPGDMLTISLLGVERSARIAAVRRIDWQNLGFNHVLVFSPNAISDAPHQFAATILIPPGGAKPGLLRQLVRSFPASPVIETGTVLRDARAMLDRMSMAILAAASVTVLAGIAVLLGAIAAARASRLYDNVILRVLGASRRQLLLLQLAEYGLLAAILGTVALGLGSAIGWLIVVKLFEFDWLPDWPTILAVLGAGLALVLGFALAGSLPLLRAKPAQALRQV